LINQPLTISDCCDFIGIFQRFVDLAPSHGFRAIAVNRRDYQGSTPYTPSEMKAIQTIPVAAQDTRAFMKDRAGETAGFIKHIVEEVGIPAPHDGRGGVVILAWSLGSVYAFNFLDMVKTLPAPLSAVVTTNVRGLIVYGGSCRHNV
jgi:pimeloyl-ACP methyl ester carboxylesterase